MNEKDLSEQDYNEQYEFNQGDETLRAEDLPTIVNLNFKQIEQNIRTNCRSVLSQMQKTGSKRQNFSLKKSSIKEAVKVNMD